MPLSSVPGPTSMASAMSRTWDSMDSDDADLYDGLAHLHAMWQANPAHPLPGGRRRGPARYLDLEFERYRDCLSRCIIYADLRSRRRPRILKAATRLESLVRLDPADEQSWALLFRVRASLPGRDAALASMLAQIRRQFPLAIPHELQYTINSITEATRTRSSRSMSPRNPRSAADRGSAPDGWCLLGIGTRIAPVKARAAGVHQADRLTAEFRRDPRDEMGRGLVRPGRIQPAAGAARRQRRVSPVPAHRSGVRGVSAV